MLARWSMQASVLLLGLLVGAMLLIAVAIAPYWRALPPAEFRTWFAANSHRIGGLMIPLGMGATICTVAALLLGLGTQGRRGWLLVAALSAVAVVAITMVVNEPANELFATAGALTDGQTSALLERWVVWHWIRVTLGLVGFGAAIRALAG